MKARSPKLAAFSAYLHLDQGLSPRSVESYCSDLALYESLLAPLPLEKLTKSKLLEQLERFQAKNYSARSLHRQLSSLKAFFVFLQTLDPQQTDPTTSI